MKPRGLPNGPKRTPTCIGDAWQNHTSYEVEEVRITEYVFPCIPVFTSLAYTDLLALNSDRFCFYVRQILADKLIKSCPYFRVKWIGINKQGCTWEPKNHLIGEKADTLLTLYLKKKEALQAAAEKRKQDVLAGNLVETGKAQNTETIEKDSNPGSQVKAEGKGDGRLRVNESPWRHHFGKWFWDNSVTPAAKRVVCLLCQVFCFSVLVDCLLCFQFY
jgi:hypothetical protein